MHAVTVRVAHDRRETLFVSGAWPPAYEPTRALALLRCLTQGSHWSGVALGARLAILSIHGAPTARTAIIDAIDKSHDDDDDDDDRATGVEVVASAEAALSSLLPMLFHTYSQVDFISGDWGRRKIEI